MRPRSMLFDLFGDYVDPHGGTIRVGPLLELAGLFDLSAPAVRSALSRLTREGWLGTPAGLGRGSYALSEKGKRLVAEGRTRIFAWPTGRWDGAWYLLTYSIPETQRERRDRLRQELAWLGCGPLSSGVYLSPHDISGPVAELAARTGLEGRVRVFRAESAWPRDDAQLAASCWDLAAIRRLYDGFLARWTPRLAEDRVRLAAGTLPDREAFARRFRLINAYRKFPFSDPDLPRALLPADWPAEQAAALFREYYALLSAGARRYYARVAGPGGRSQEPGDTR